MSVDALNAPAPTPAAAEENGVFSRSGVLRRLARDKVAVVAALLLATIGLAAIFAPLVAPYDPYLTDLTKETPAIVETVAHLAQSHEPTLPLQREGQRHRIEARAAVAFMDADRLRDRQPLATEDA